MRFFAILLILLMTIFQIGARSIDPSPKMFIDQKSWQAVVARQVTNQNPKDNDVSELMSRLVLVSAGEDLSEEALVRTLALANSPKTGFGFLKNDGFKWLTAMHVVALYDQQVRLKDLEKENEDLERQVANLNQRLLALEKLSNTQPSAK